MTKCSFRFCKSVKPQYPKNDGMAYFRFPKHLIRRERWIEVVRRQRGEPDFEPNTASLVCSKHFNKTDLYFAKKGARVKGTAVPIIDPVNLNASIEEDGKVVDKSNQTSQVVSKPSTTKFVYQCSIKTSDSECTGKKQKTDTSDDAHIETDNTIFSGYENPFLTTTHDNNSEDEEIENIIKIEVEESSNSEEDNAKVGDKKEMDDIRTRDLDKFGEHVAAMLKRIPMKRSLDLQLRIIQMITSAMQDDETLMIKK